LTGRMINIGCGNKYHKDWVNIDIDSASTDVIRYDIRKGLPFPDNSFDAAYSSHILEHLTPEEGLNFLSEQNRILKKGGIIRVVVPDLEIICRNYIKYLESSLAGDMQGEFRYDYTVTELFDQMTRKTSGGNLGKIWREGIEKDARFVIERHGREVYDLLQGENELLKSNEHRAAKRNTIRVFSDFNLRISRKLVRFLLGEKYLQYFDEGVFRNKGEVHKTMYDRFSIVKLLEKAGFVNAAICTAFESRISEFGKYELDTLNGEIRKPDSLFAEGEAAGK
jgi:predicted SAM-dependent methyltransferase